MRILVTGAAGFIGFHLAQRLLHDGVQVYGIDNLNDYYDVNLKQARLAQLRSHPNFQFQCFDLSDRNSTAALFSEQTFDCVVHLAAQAGVRYSIKNPDAYIDSNIVGFANVLEGCRHQKIAHLVFASSSSVYGASHKVPSSVEDNVDHPVSLYAATKKANELMAHSYSHLYDLPVTGLRFFTVYGPWGRPDMAYFAFVDAIASNQPIDVYNHGYMERDFTYIDDVIEGIVRVIHRPPQTSAAPYKIYNIGNHTPVNLLRFIEVIEAELGKTAQKNWLPMQPGDVPITYADVTDLMQDTGFQPQTSLEDGIHAFVEWYHTYHTVKLHSLRHYSVRPRCA
ncbi:UDP-N-acetylglucosamine 4-epimerase [Acaryochloris thomasi RCC1774]|uniref:UDP-N-acetylglucosamine 4-epimerase n=1 Tax=Acaryochloris thomasi RCC1774 TaxID=1764569 RepID=A0A2W1JQ13_9CYAN|nr:NAD-dependent epimerase [Acaryochloris thomasi]PZD73505.1 UDP-N-acetylglucosamine 4-epimerase [Acaryochloris thomasi RCC1774]